MGELVRKGSHEFDIIINEGDTLVLVANYNFNIVSPALLDESFNVRKKLGGSLTYDWSGAMSNTDDTTTTLTQSLADVPPGTYFYSWKYTNAESEINTYAFGKLIIIPTA